MCVCVCVFVSLSVCVRVCVHVPTYIRMYMHMYSICVCMHIRTCVYAVCICIKCATYIRMYCMYALVSDVTFVRAYVHTIMYVHVCTCGYECANYICESVNCIIACTCVCAVDGWTDSVIVCAVFAMS